jgi:hypothetical protein
MYDYFVAQLLCPKCGHLSEVAEFTNMQTKIRADANGSELCLGFIFDKADLQRKRIIDSGYSLVQDLPASSSVIRLLNVWSCPSCETDQWAMIEIKDACITDIHAVGINQDSLNAANFIATVDAELLAAELLDVPSWSRNGGGRNPIDVLRQRLP